MRGRGGPMDGGRGRSFGLRRVGILLAWVGVWIGSAAWGWGGGSVEAAERVNSPENQVFQFMESGTRADWRDGARTTATAYLWVPEHCRRLRGLLVLGTNVPEHMLVGHPEIRAVAAANDLGIVWSTPTFWYSKAKGEDQTVVAFLQQLLDGLAKTSGYEEVATVPWIPIGESGHLLMVDALVEAAPERCIAGIWLKNPHLPPHNRTVPALVIFGTAQEWGQDKADYATVWQDVSFYDTVRKRRRESPDWPLTFLIDGTSGHFDVSERLVHVIAGYIDRVSRARLPKDGAGALRKVELGSGYVAALPVGGRRAAAPRAFGVASAEERAEPWFFDRAGAEEAQRIATTDWEAASPLPGFVDGSGRQMPFDLNGISTMVPEMEADGATFHLRSVLLDRLPENFLHAGAPLAKEPVAPTLEWMCGAVEPAGKDTFRVAMDRSYRQQAIYYVARAPGGPGVRPTVQPIGIKLEPNREGQAQTITFAPIRDVKVGTGSVELRASSDAGLPVSFFVVAGPAVIREGRVVLEPIPPRARFPVTVTVAAWQWGRGSGEKVKTAETVRQSFQITR